ncbi:MAG: M20/M25/M40 family metallo-hydrolase [Deltaproteobacteria bacterium]|nr:M20/M25/M40 family metallo-hydrolase [Deltaproteobacteria bacterium]
MSGLSPSIRLLRDLVAIPSVNPMGRLDLPAELVGEERVARFCAEELGRRGLDVAVLGEGGRTSVLAMARAGAGAETVLIASHLDTVPVDGMEIDPFDPFIADGQLHGRGSCDTKSGMAALLVALGRVLERGTLARNVIVVGEADEEHRSVGAFDVLAALGDARPDWALATEPTGLRLIHAHKGVVHARLRARGRACHSSDPSAGRNAIVLLARAILAVEASARIFLARPHPDLGPATLSIGVVGGGHAPNIVPDDAWLWVDRRTLPGEKAESVKRELEDVLEHAGLAGEVVIDSCREEKPPLGNEPGSLAVRGTASVLDDLGLPSTVAPVAFGTDAGVFSRVGIPSVVIGPGSIAAAHTARESVPIAEVETMARIFERLLESKGAR